MTHPRTITSWDLTLGGQRLNVYWTEPDSDTLFLAHLTSDRQLEPWQVDGLVAAVRAGAPIAELTLPEVAPLRGLLYRSLLAVADSLFTLADRLTVGHSLAGGNR